MLVDLIEFINMPVNPSKNLMLLLVMLVVGTCGLIASIVADDDLINDQLEIANKKEAIDMYTAAEAHYCVKHTLWVELPDTSITADQDRCFCVDSCINDRLTELMGPSTITTEPVRYGNSNYALFTCMQMCFNTSITAATFKDQTKGPRRTATEADILSTLITHLGPNNPYSSLINQLDQTFQQDQLNRAERLSSLVTNGSSKYQIDRNTDMADCCFAHAIIQKLPGGSGLKPAIEQTIKCRLFMRCFVARMLKLVALGNSDTEVCRDPNRCSSWQLYVCARDVFVQPPTIQKETSEIQ